MFYRFFLPGSLILSVGLEFVISVNHDGKNYRFHIYEGRRTLGFQYYHLRAKNKTMTFQTNLPVLRRNDIKDRPTFEVTEGGLQNKEFQEKIIDEIWERLKGLGM